MPIAGVVLTFSSDRNEAARARQEVAQCPQVLLGVPFGNRVPAVLETQHPKLAEKLWHDLLSVPGVMNVELVTVNFEDDVSDAAEEVELTSISSELWRI